MKNCVYIATTLDGFIARENGKLDWLPGAEEEAEHSTGEDFGFANFFESIDVLLMGRKSFEFVESSGKWPYSNKRVIVLSKTIKKNLPHNIEVQSGCVEEIFRDLQISGAKRVYVDGGQTIQSFLNFGLIHEITITKVPVIIGRGIPLFGATHKDIQLSHIETTSYSNGFVQSRYDVLP